MHQCSSPRFPHIILSTPCETIREASQNYDNNFRMNLNGTNHRRSSSIKSKTHSQDSNSDPQFAWVRRHSLHSQPQPLSVHGFGYRYNTNPTNNRLERSTGKSIVEFQGYKH